MTIVTRQTPTLIDILSAGYNALNRRLWVLIIPVLANVYVAFGPQVSLAPLVADVRSALSSLADVPDADKVALAEADQRLAALSSVDMRQPLLWLNYVPLLARVGVDQSGGDPLPSTGVPLLAAERGDTLTIRSGGGLLGIITLLNSVALVCSGLFLHQIAQGVDSTAERLGTGLLRGLRLVALIGLWHLLALIALLIIAVPYAILGAMATLLLPAAAPVLVVVFGLAFFWIGIYIGFSAEAMALDGIGPLSAVRRSFALVRRNFFASVGLLLLIWLIGLGLGLLWDQLSSSPVGLIIASVGSAYIGAGLAAARMVFYRERTP